MITIRPPEPSVSPRGHRCEYVYLQYPPEGWDKRMPWKVGEEPGCPVEVAKESTLFDEPFTIILPDGRRFGCLMSRSKGNGFVDVVKWHGTVKGLLTGVVEQEEFLLSNGERFALSACELRPEYLFDKKSEGAPKAKRKRAEKAKGGRQKKSAGSEPVVDFDKLIKLADQCLASEGMETLRIYEFKEEEEARDDERQEELAAEFKAAFGEVATSLQSHLGEGVIAATEEEMAEVPLGGVFCAAFWQVGSKRLFVAAAHEDRETPYLLMMGTV
jgi:hypothetical protein